MSLTNAPFVLLPVPILRNSHRVALSIAAAFWGHISTSGCSCEQDATETASALPKLEGHPASDILPLLATGTQQSAAPSRPLEKMTRSLVYAPPRVVVDNQPRLYPLTRNVWVFPQPNAHRSWIGFLWFGSSVILKDMTPIAGPQCKGAWYAVEPRGFVCVDEKKATLNSQHESLRGITRFSPKLESPWPHRYGESIDLRRYRVLPTEKQQRASEWYYGQHQAKVRRARSGEQVPSLLGIDLEIPSRTLLPLPPIPRNLRMGRSRLKRRSTVAWSEEVNHEGRPFLLSADLLWVPKDRVKVYPPVEFQGVHLGAENQLPIAFIRQQNRPRYARAKNGSFVEKGSPFARLSSVMLTDIRVVQGGSTFIETTTAGQFIKQSDAVLPTARKQTPWGTPLGAARDSKAPSRGRQTWMEVSILGGWLIAYEGHRPVFTTLISPGRGGAPQKNRRAIETASTPTGRFKVTGKFATATMVSSNELVHSSVPWAQNFSGPHALHSAYWHNDWGQLKSGGCINLSPIDGQWLFQNFTEPALPEGWHGVRWLPKKEAATTLLIKRR